MGAGAEVEGCNVVMHTDKNDPHLFHLRRGDEADWGNDGKAVSYNFPKTCKKKCAVPTEPTNKKSSYGCGGGSLGKCLNDNKQYASLKEAWEACAEVEGCNVVSHQDKTD